MTRVLARELAVCHGEVASLPQNRRPNKSRAFCNALTPTRFGESLPANGVGNENSAMSFLPAGCYFGTTRFEETLLVPETGGPFIGCSSQPRAHIVSRTAPALRV